MRNRKSGDQCRETFRQLLQLPGAHAAHRPLQRPDSAPGGCPQDLLAICSRVDLHAALIPFVPATLDPTARGETFQHVTYRGALHSQACGQPRGGNPRFFADACQRAMHRNGRVGRTFELAIKRSHAIDERARRQQRIAFERTSPAESGCIAGASFSE